MKQLLWLRWSRRIGIDEQIDGHHNLTRMMVVLVMQVTTVVMV